MCGVLNTQCSHEPYAMLSAHRLHNAMQIRRCRAKIARAIWETDVRCCEVGKLHAAASQLPAPRRLDGHRSLDTDIKAVTMQHHAPPRLQFQGRSLGGTARIRGKSEWWQERAHLQSDESPTHTSRQCANTCVCTRSGLHKRVPKTYLHLRKSLPGTNAPPQRLDQGGGCAVHVEVRLARKHAPGGLNDRGSEIPDLVAQDGQSAGKHAWSR
jgi:hypothetical protein